MKQNWINTQIAVNTTMWQCHSSPFSLKSTPACINISLKIRLSWYLQCIIFYDCLEAGREDEAIFDFLSTLNDVFTQLQIIKDRWYDLEAGVSVASPGESLRKEKESSSRGRPKYIILKEQLLFLRELRFTWTMIASMYGVS